MHYSDIATPGNYGAWGALSHVGETTSAKYAALLRYLSDNNQDRDGDGVPNTRDAFPDNPQEWLDTDKDGIGNHTDTDDDGDGLPDTWEAQYGLNPLDARDAAGDLDNDGLSNLLEYQKGTDPLKLDSDGDGMTDQQESSAGRNPSVNEPAVMQVIDGILP